MTAEALIEAWAGLAIRANVLLRDPGAPDIEPRLRKLDTELCELLSGEPNGSLLWLVHHNTQQPKHYSVLHALLVAAVCDMTADCLPDVTTEMRTATRLAALTMNLGITRLQDELVRQLTPPTDEQREALRDHGERAAALLHDGGVTDALWLTAVEQHHSAPSDALAELAPALRVARLVQQADIFAARLSPREVRHALAANDAAKGIYFNEQKTPDDTGAAIIKAVGIYLPGSAVLLRSGEVAVVVRRGLLANQPLVASITNRQGMPVSAPQLRDSREPDNAVVSGLPPHQLRVRVVLRQVLRLALQAGR